MEINLSPDTEAAVLEAMRSMPMTGMEVLGNMLKAIQSGDVEIISQEFTAPDAVDGEMKLEFRFHLRAKSAY